MSDWEYPAFPVPYGMTNGADGMSLRDYFAAKAMAALIDPAQHNSDQHSEYLSAHEGLESIHDDFVSARAYEIADAMLRARAAKD